MGGLGLAGGMVGGLGGLVISGQSLHTASATSVGVGSGSASHVGARRLNYARSLAHTTAQHSSRQWAMARTTVKQAAAVRPSPMTAPALCGPAAPHPRPAPAPASSCASSCGPEQELEAPPVPVGGGPWSVVVPYERAPAPLQQLPPQQPSPATAAPIALASARVVRKKRRRPQQLRAAASGEAKAKVPDGAGHASAAQRGALRSPTASPARSRRRQGGAAAAAAACQSSAGAAESGAAVAAHVLRAAQRVVEARKKKAVAQLRTVPADADAARRLPVDVEEQAAKAEERVRARQRQLLEEKQRAAARKAEKSKEGFNAEEERTKAEQRVMDRRKQASQEQQAAASRVKEERGEIDSRRAAQQQAKEQRRAKIYALNKLMRLSREQRALGAQQESV